MFRLSHLYYLLIKFTRSVVHGVYYICFHILFNIIFN
nr:MAG TPA: hypothetical protein [Bacteriophage sp.]